MSINKEIQIYFGRWMVVSGGGEFERWGKKSIWINCFQKIIY